MTCEVALDFGYPLNVKYVTYSSKIHWVVVLFLLGSGHDLIAWGRPEFIRLLGGAARRMAGSWIRAAAGRSGGGIFSRWVARRESLVHGGIAQ